MPTPTYTPLANITLSGSAATVVFSSISQIYRDVVLVISGSWASVNSYAEMRFEFNGDTTSTNYSRVSMRGSGGAFSNTANTNSFPGISFGYGNPAPIWTVTANIQDYNTTDRHKPYLVRTNESTDGHVSASALRWANTAAINSIAIKADLSFAANTTFELFGVSS